MFWMSDLNKIYYKLSELMKNGNYSYLMIKPLYDSFKLCFRCLKKHLNIYSCKTYFSVSITFITGYNCLHSKATDPMSIWLVKDSFWDDCWTKSMPQITLWYQCNDSKCSIFLWFAVEYELNTMRTQRTYVKRQIW